MINGLRTVPRPPTAQKDPRATAGYPMQRPTAPLMSGAPINPNAAQAPHANPAGTNAGELGMPWHSIFL